MSDPVSSPLSVPFLKRFERRSFLSGGALLVWGVVLGETARADSTAGGLSNLPQGDATPSLFLALDAEGTVRFTCHRSEMGQQTWTSMTQLIVDELGASWDAVRLEQAIGHPRYGDQNTDGSRSVRKNFDRLRIAGAALRLVLERAAAERWGVAPSSCRANEGVVVHEPTKRSLRFGELAEEASKLPLPELDRIRLRSRPEWRYIQKSMPSLSTPHIVRGEGTFGIDVRLPDMMHAVIARPPQVLGRAKGFDASAATEFPGVVRVLALPTPTSPVRFQPLGGIAVVARDTWSAIRGRELLRIDWDPGPNQGYESQSFEKKLRAEVRKPGQVRRSRGDVSGALERAAQRFEAEYYVPHLAHSTMEPPSATARWRGERVECWGCVQAPQAARRTVAEVCGVDEDQVTIFVTLLGGGFGRKSKPDHFAEAAWLARQVQAPVKVTWTREDDLRHGYYHTVSVQRLEGGLDAEGRCSAWLHRTAFPPIRSTFDQGATEPTWGDLRQGASDTPFAVDHLQLESGAAEAHVRIGWLRSVANIYHAFAVQSFAAELAHAAGRDPKDYLLELIGPPRHIDPNEEGADYDNYGSPLAEYPIDTGRMAAVVEIAADLAGWGRALPPGHGLGIAVHRSFVSYVATVVEVFVDDAGRLTIPGVWSAIDAGTVVNPNHVESQLEGGTLFGLSNALYGRITVTGGAVEQKNFPDFRVMRMNEAPRAMQVRVVQSNAPPGGVGEPPTPPAAPALTNAIFAATGLRIRRLPIFGPDRRDRLQLASAPPERRKTP